MQVTVSALLSKTSIVFVPEYVEQMFHPKKFGFFCSMLFLKMFSLTFGSVIFT